MFVAALGACGSSTDDPSGDSSQSVTGEASKRRCAALVQKVLGAPLVPGTSFGGFELGKGTKDSRGMTIDEANAAHCATSLGDSPSAGLGGYRAMRWGGDNGLTLSYNLDSRVAYLATAGSDYSGTVSFRSRVDGAFGDHSYEVGRGRVLRDGVPLSIDWTSLGWASELDDALLATFDPAAPPATANCRTSGSCLFLTDDGSGGAIFGARPLHFFITFKAGTDIVTGFYSRWLGGNADCTTPRAALERMEYEYVEGGFSALTPSFAVGPWIGGLELNKFDKTGSRPVTWQDADALICNGASVPAPDPGYGAIQWGAGGALLVEFNPATSAVYKAIARSGYKGTFDTGRTTSSEGWTTHDFTLTIGSPPLEDGATVTVDWGRPSSFTDLSNSVLGQNDADCVATKACVVTPDDGQGRSLFAVPDAGIEIAFKQGTSFVVSFTAIALGGK